MFQTNYWNNAITPNRLKHAQSVLEFTSRTYKVKLEHINNIVFVESEDKGNVYNYVNEYKIVFGKTPVKIVLTETFHSYSTKPLDDIQIRGISYTNINYEIADTLNNVEQKLILFSETFHTHMTPIIDQFQREYSEIHYWENPSYYESDGSEPVPESISLRPICFVSTTE